MTAKAPQIYDAISAHDDQLTSDDDVKQERRPNADKSTSSEVTRHPSDDEPAQKNSFIEASDVPPVIDTPKRNTGWKTTALLVAFYLVGISALQSG